MTKMAVIMAESVLYDINGQCYPCVILIGRDYKKKRIKWRTKYFPYFYLTEKDYMELKDTGYFDDLHIQEVSGCRARNLMRRVMTKISVTDAGRVKESIKSLNKWNKVTGEGKTIFTYEADLSKSDLLALRYMIDNKIKSGVDISKSGTVKPIDMQVELRKWYIDFEAYTTKEYSSGLGRDEPIIMVSIWDSYDNKMYTLYTVNNTWKVKWQLEQFLEPFKDFPHEVISFKTEANLLDALMELVIDKDPDLITAWNLNRYDIEKWKQRVDYNSKKCIHPFKDISPFHSILWNNKPRRVKGRVLFDLMVAFKQFTDAEIRSYALSYITEEEKLGFPKISFEGTSGYTWDNRPDIMFLRNVYDVLIIKALDEKYGLIDTYNDLRTEFGTLFHETFVAHRVIDTALMKLIHGKVVLKTADFGKSEEEEKLLGAIVKEPDAKAHYYVAQFDFSREYPNIIKGFNISPETYTTSKKIDDSDCYVVKYTHEEKGEMVFRFIKRPLGLLPTLIQYFFDKRNEYERGRVEAIANKKAEHKIKMWDRRAYNIKKKTNAIYGVMDYPKFRLHRKECTQATAVIGRIGIEELNEYVESIGYNLLYGDTDSIFIKLQSTNKEECVEEGKKLQDKLNKHLSQFFTEKYGVAKAPAELAFQELYQKIIFFGKKNYAAKKIWDEKREWHEDYKFKGIASVRTDSSNLEKSTLEQLLKFVLDDINIKVIEAFIEQVILDFKNRKFDYIDVSYPAQLKTRMFYHPIKKYWVTNYAKLGKRGVLTFPAHARAVIYSNMYLNTDFMQGDKPRRLPVKLPKDISKAQITLFRKDKVFPTEWIYKGKTGGIKEDIVIKVKDISVVEDMHIPQFFLDNIDWDRIEKRLQKKIDTVMTIHLGKTLNKTETNILLKESE